MVHIHTVPICTTIVGSHTIVVLVLRNGLSMCMLMSSMMRMLLLMMTLLLVVPGRLSLRVLLLVREDMLRVDHSEGRRVIRRSSDLFLIHFKYYLEMSIDRTGTSSRHWKDLRFEVRMGSFYHSKLMQVLRFRLLFARRLSVVRRRRK